MRHRPRWGRLGPLLLLSASCGREGDVQLVTGQPQFPAREVRAFFDSGALSAAATVDPELGFVIALPVDATHRLYVVRDVLPEVTPLGPEAGLQVCRADAPVDLGPVLLDLGPCPPEPPECLVAQDDLTRCEGELAPVCARLAEQISICRDDRELLCGPLDLNLQDCLRTTPPCEAEQRELDQCLSEHDCEPPEAAYLDTCLQPCADEQRAVEATCGAPEPEPCDAEPVAWPDVWPDTVGCEEGA